jgi:hypothetical protein
MLAAFLVTLLLAASCQEKPVTPTPSSLGGWPQSIGGAIVNDLGGMPAAGSPWGIGGSTATGGSGIAGATPINILPFKKFACNALQTERLGFAHPKLGRIHHKTRMIGRAKAKYLIAGDLSNVIWPTHLKRRIDQTNIGRCTGYACANIYNNEPFLGQQETAVAELLGDDFYHWATVLDSYKGTWLPDDTGSDGLSVMTGATTKVKVDGHYAFTGFKTISDFVEIQKALQKGPCIIGTNWYSSMFNTTKCGQVEIAVGATVEGGHEYGWVGMDYDEKVGWFINSWGNDFGVYDENGVGGYFKLSFGTIMRLLNEDGEVECPTPPANDNSIPYKKTG